MKLNMKKAGAGLLSALMAVSSCPGIAFAAEEAPASAIVNLKTEGMTDPLGIDAAQPRFSWQMQSSEIGAAQQSYQIVVTVE